MGHGFHFAKCLLTSNPGGYWTALREFNMAIFPTFSLSYPILSYYIPMENPQWKIPVA